MSTGPKMTEEQKAFFSGEASRSFPSSPMPLSTEAAKRFRAALIQAADNARNGIYKSELVDICAENVEWTDDDWALSASAWRD